MLDEGGLVFAGDFKKEKYEVKIANRIRDFIITDQIFARQGPVDPLSSSSKHCSFCEKDLGSGKKV